MQMKLSNRVWGIIGILSGASSVLAHPGHAPTDLAAQVSQPLAGPDHLVAFVALSSVLLVALRALIKRRDVRSTKRQAPSAR